MARFPVRVTLGRSGLEVGPLGLAGGYGIDARAAREAFDCGVNYWYHGSRRCPGMRAAVREIVAAGLRDELVVVLQSYSRSGWYLERSLNRGLDDLGIDHADVLLLGWYNRRPPDRVLQRAERLRTRGLVRHLAVSGHKRPAFVDLASIPAIDILQIRYNAAHTGAEQDVFPHLGEDNRPGIVAYTATRWGQLLKESKMPPGEAPLRGRDAYRFVLSNPDFDVCFTGPRNAEELTEALACLDEGPLSEEEDARFRAIGQYVHEGSLIG